MNVVLALVLGALALAILFYIGSLLYGAVGRPVRGFIERQYLARHLAQAGEGDSLLEQGRTDEALAAFVGSFFLTPYAERTLASTVANHHTGLLSRLIAMTSEAQGGTVRLLSLAKVDRLLQDRTTLQKSYFLAAEGPSGQRRRELRTHLATNRRELQAALAQLADEIRATRSERAQYH